MRKVARKDATGGAAIVVPIGSGRGESGGKVFDNGSAAYKVNIPKDGNYRLLARVFWKDTSNNSFFYAWDGGKPEMLGNDGDYGKWHWIQTGPKRVEGRRTLLGHSESR